MDKNKGRRRSIKQVCAFALAKNIGWSGKNRLTRQSIVRDGKEEGTEAWMSGEKAFQPEKRIKVQGGNMSGVFEDEHGG